MYECRSCKEQFAEWQEACPACSAFRSLQRQAQTSASGSTTCPPRRNRGSLITAKELAKVDLISMPLSSSWRGFLGSVPAQFGLMAFGPAGGGKSTFLLGFATELCRHGKVLFAAAEEGHSNSLIEKLNRLEVFSDRILISSAINVEELSADLDRDSAIKFLIVDSIAALPVTVAQLSDIAEARRLGVAFSLHATKNGSYRGATSWAHWVDVVARVDDGNITLEKNRFGPLSTGRLNWDYRERECVQL